MTELNPKIIKDSFEIVKPIAVEAVTYFYDLLFEKYPDAKPLFENVDMDKQRKSLINALVKAVENLEDGPTLVGYLEKLGGRHNNYGVAEEHYALVGDCLIETFAHFFQDGWTPELEAQWMKVYCVISAYMIKGMREQGASSTEEASAA